MNHEHRFAAVGLCLIALAGCGESKPSSGSATSAVTSAAAASTASAASTSSPSATGAASTPPATPGPSKIVVGECTFAFDSPGLPTRDSGSTGDLEQWINHKTHVVLGLFRETKRAATEPRTVADLEKKYGRMWDAPVTKGSANGVSLAVFHTGASDSNAEVRAIGAAEASTDAVSCTFDISGPAEREAEMTTLAKSMRITVSAKGP